MRKADFDVAWEACRAPDRAQLAIHELDLVRGDGTNQQLLITGRITALVGVNGAGKTGFLRGVKAVVGGAAGARARPVISGISGRFRGADFSITPRAPGAPGGLGATLVDVSLEVHRILSYVEGQSDFDDVLTQYEARDITGRELGGYRYLCGRPYASLKIYEVELPVREGNDGEAVETDAVFPFFKVEAGGVLYDSREMGFGELCACYLIWCLRRANRGSIVLLDEPDSHLSPVSRRAMSNMLALISKERELWVLFSTHAVEPLSALNESEICVIQADERGTSPTVASVEVKREALKALGMSQIPRLLVVVEDVDAEEVVKQVVNRWGGEFAGSIDIKIVRGGATEVARFISLFPVDSRFFQSIAIIDGDKRADYQDSERILFLPGADDPISAAIGLVRANPGLLAEVLSVNPVVMSRAIVAMGHVDHHDFCADLIARLELHLTVPKVREALVRIWLEQREVAEEASGIARQLGELVDSIPVFLG